MKHCYKATFLVSQSHERQLTLAERVKMRLHLAVCPACRHFADQLPWLSQAAKIHSGTIQAETPPDAPPPENLSGKL